LKLLNHLILSHRQIRDHALKTKKIVLHLSDLLKLSFGLNSEVIQGYLI